MLIFLRDWQQHKMNEEPTILEQETEEEKESVEEYFFKYSFPCAQSKLYSGDLDKEDYDKLNNLFLQRKFPDKETLERIFPVAFGRLQRLADRMGKSKWDLEVLEKYWREVHNELVDRDEGMYFDGSERLKDLCRVYIAKVIEKKGDKLVVSYNNKKRIVSGFLVPEAGTGNFIRIHYFHAIELVK